jgi:hypothetical protein
MDAVYLAIVAVFGALIMALYEFCDALKQGERP